MVSEKKALTGNRVYRMGSYAPTRGTNNPTGYLKRELKKRGGKATPAKKAQPLARKEPIKKAVPQKHGISQTGGDGKSDTRSGLAAKMLPGQSAQYSAGGTSTAPKSPTGGVGKVPSTVKINPYGQLQLPFSYEFSMSALERQQDANRALQMLGMDQQEQAQEYLKNMRTINQGYGEQKAQAINTASGRGTAFSSAYGKRVVGNATNYNNALGDLENQNIRANVGFTTQRNQIQADLNDYLRKLAMQRGVELDGQAGTLGLGKAR